MSGTKTPGPVRATMTHRATIQRDTVGNDAEGNPAAPVWGAHLASQPCWFFYGPSTREQIDGDVSVVVEDARMQVPFGTDVTEQDRVTAVADRRGTAVHTGVLNIRAVTPRATHLELVLEGAAP